jgi:hypothetical protein
LEKSILKQIHYLETINHLDLTGKSQHGFKKIKVQSQQALLQSIIACAADNDNFAIMASLGLSGAFDLVNIELLVRRLGIIGLPRELVGLVRDWLEGREFYVEVG